MALLTDFHDDLKLPPEAIAQIPGDTRTGRAGPFSVRQAGLYHDPDRKAYCLPEGPGEDAIRAHPAAPGVPGGGVRQATPLPDGSQPART